MINKIDLNKLSNAYEIKRLDVLSEPIFYSENGRQLIHGNNLIDVADNVPNLTLNWRYFAKIWENDFSYQELSPFNEILKAPTKTRVIFERTSPKRLEYLEPFRASYTFKNKEDVLDQLDELIVENLKNYEKKESALFLSGGLESTLIFAIIQKHKLNIPAVHLSFTQEPQQDKFSSRYLFDLFNGKFTNLRAEELKLINTPPWYGRANCFAFWNFGLELFTPMYEWAVENNIKYVLTGTGGDDLFTFNSSYLLPLLKKQGISISSIDELVNFFKYYKSEGIINFISQLTPLKLKYAIKSQFKKSTSYVLYNLKNLNFNYLESIINWRFIYSGIYNFVFEQEQERARLYKLNMGYPLISDSILQLMVSTPLEMHIQFPNEKPLLRALAMRYLPPEVANYHNNQSYHKLVQQQAKKCLKNQLIKLNNSKWPTPFCNLHFKESMLSSNANTEQLLKLLYIKNFEDFVCLHKTKKKPITKSQFLKNMET